MPQPLCCSVLILANHKDWPRDGRFCGRMRCQRSLTPRNHGCRRGHRSAGPDQQARLPQDRGRIAFQLDQFLACSQRPVGLKADVPGTLLQRPPPPRSGYLTGFFLGFRSELLTGLQRPQYRGFSLECPDSTETVDICAYTGPQLLVIDDAGARALRLLRHAANGAGSEPRHC